ncbi:hypothetical protein MCOR02_008717 [Pyricularia oryzae]|nr:hypothetical protein MCOR02_008717 [Pyricularia oryzae]KAI6477593.1 hypothetical protein MCOR17_000490 [Pyricularia oryzae]KAI6510030.1 hypothetical protein MCOR13_001351 [Pyricularia oryzae]KAI6550334.1 hypothetical protein MCOR04_011289 [Pyricularia oryzae]
MSAGRGLELGGARCELTARCMPAIKTAAHLIARQTRVQVEAYQKEQEESFKSFGTGAIVAIVISVLLFFGITISIIVLAVKSRNRRLAANAATSSYLYGNGNGPAAGPGYNGPYTSIPNPAPVAPPVYSNGMYGSRSAADLGRGQQQQQQLKSTGAGADPAVGMEPYRPTGQVADVKQASQ